MKRFKMSRAEIARIKAGVTMPALLRESVTLIRDTKSRFIALCPYHVEDTASFSVWADHAHCFGCGWSGDTVTWLMDREQMSFDGALRHLCEMAGSPEPKGLGIAREADARDYGWTPLRPVPSDAPSLMLPGGWTQRLWNPKRQSQPREWARYRPVLVHPYRGTAGELFGYVLRCQFPSGKKFTPTVTYCVDDAGERRWCLIPFLRPRGLYGLERLAVCDGATVLLVEGEKAADAAQRLMPNFVAMTWAGGAKAYPHSDFSPLAGRKVVCIPDADVEGRNAFDGRVDARGHPVPGILEILASVGAKARRVEPPESLPDGWDLADAEAEEWDTARTVAWIKAHLIETRDTAA